MHIAPLALINLDHPDRFLGWGPIQISVANLVVIGLILLLFLLAILLPFPGGKGRS